MSKTDSLISNSIELFNDARYTEVIKMCKGILDVDSSCESALYYLGLSYYKLDNFIKSEKYLERAYEINPENYMIINDYARL